MADDDQVAFHTGSGPAFSDTWTKIVPRRPPSQSDSSLPPPPGPSYFEPLSKY